MPNFPKSSTRPWHPETEKQAGRIVKTGFYHTTPWRKFRAKYIKENPLCVECLKQNIITPGNVVDHIKQINRANPYDTKHGMHGEPLSEDNVQTLCNRHHNSKSGRERWSK